MDKDLKTLKEHLHISDLGPTKVSDDEKHTIATQIINFIMKSKNMDKTPDELFNFVDFALIYGKEKTYNTGDAVLNKARYDNTSLPESAESLLKNFDIKLNDIFGENECKTSKKETKHTIINRINLYTQQNPIMILKSIKKNCTEWHFQDIIQYSDSNGDFIFGECFYHDNEDRYFLLTMQRQKTFALREYNQYVNDSFTYTYGYSNEYKLMNENFMVTHPDKPIYIFLDKRIANNLSPKFQSSPKGLDLHHNIPDFIEKLQFIPSTFGGNNLSLHKINLKHIKHRDIVIIPIGLRDSYKFILKQAKHLLDAKPKNLSICTVPIILHKKLSTPKEQSSIDDKLLRHIVQKSINFDEKFNALNDLKPHILPFNNYKKWVNQFGVGGNTHSLTSYSNQPLSSYTQNEIEHAEPYIENFISPEYLSACIGEHHTGKTLVGYTLGLSLACAKNVFYFKSQTKQNVIYVDAETVGYQAVKKIFQIANAYNIDKDDIDNFFHLLPKDDMIGISLLEEEAQHKIIEKIEHFNATVIIFDNLLKLAPEVITSSVKLNALTNWFTHIASKYKISVLYIHHLKKDGNTMGLQQIQMTTNNIFTITKTNHPDNASGCTMTLCVTKNKVDPKFDNLKRTYFLDAPQNDLQPQPWVYLNSSQENIKENKSFFYKDNLTDRQNKILKLLFNSDKPMSAREIEAQFTSKKSTINNEINVLKANNFIEVIGKGRATKYHYREDSTIEVG